MTLKLKFNDFKIKIKIPIDQKGIPQKEIPTLQQRLRVWGAAPRKRLLFSRAPTGNRELPLSKIQRGYY